MSNYKLPYYPTTDSNNYNFITEPKEFTPVGDLDDFIFNEEQSYSSER